MEMSVQFSAQQNSWYIADEAGECVSGLYDTEQDARNGLAEERASAEAHAPKIESVRRHAGVAGQVSFTAKVTYVGEPTSEVTFVGSEVYGGPVVMVLPSGAQTWVSDPGRHGKFCEEWVRRFFA